MTQIFEDTRAIPVTVIQAGPCFVAQVKTEESDGYAAVQLAFGAPPGASASRCRATSRSGRRAQPVRRRAPHRRRRQLHGRPADHGGPVRARRAGGRGRREQGQGVRRRHEAPRLLRPVGPATARSASTARPARSARAPRPRACSRACVWPGQMGNERVTVLNLQVVRADPERNLLLIRGAVPGPDGGARHGALGRQGARREGSLMPKVDIVSTSGKKVASRDLSADVFEADVNVPADASGGRRRHGVAPPGDALDEDARRGPGGGRKPWRQKGTGRARQGSNRAPQWAGGGVVHGPQPRDHDMRVNKKMKKGALRGALTDTLASGKLAVVEELAFDAPKTKRAAEVLDGAGPRGQDPARAPGAERQRRRREVLPQPEGRAGGVREEPRRLRAPRRRPRAVHPRRARRGGGDGAREVGAGTGGRGEGGDAE